MAENLKSATLPRVGTTAVSLSNDLIGALSSLGIRVRGFGDTQIRNGIADFQITGGSANLNTTQVEIIHSGGLTLRRGERTRVNLTDFVISNQSGRPVLTGLVTVNGNRVGRVPLFNLQIGNLETSTQNGLINLDLERVQVSLTQEAATALNQVFQVNAFTPGFNVGNAEVDAFVNPNTGNIVPVRQLSVGDTSVAFSNDLVSALGALDIQVEGFGGTQIKNGVANFLITGGAADLDTAKVEVIHSGGLIFKAGDTAVKLTDFVISNLGDRTVLTGLVTANGNLLGRVALFNLQVGGLETSTQLGLINLDLERVRVSLTGEAAAALNQIFEVNAFTAGFNIGTAEVDAFVNSNTGDIVQVGRGRRIGEVRPDRVEAPREGGAIFREGSADREASPIRESSEVRSREPNPLASTFDVNQTGETSVTLSDDLINAFGVLNIQAEGFGGTQIKNGVVDFLITGGAADLDATRVEIIHSGGLTLKSGNTAVNLTDFVISNLGDRAVLTGLLTVNGDLVARTDLFNLQVGEVDASKRGGRIDLELGNVGVSLTNNAATALNQIFNVNAFTPGFNIGAAEVDALLT